VLKENGYATGGFGKWHLTPDHVQGAAGPHDRWPMGWGFDHFWGFLGAESGQYDPLIMQDNTIIGVPEGKGLRAVLPARCYDRPGDQVAALGPRAGPGQALVPVLLHRLRARAAPCPGPVEPEVPGPVRPGLGQAAGGDLRTAEAARRYPGGRGADPRPDTFPAWDSLSENEKKLYARQMEVYAGYQENADHNAARLLDAVAEMGEADNTLVFYIFGDNGASLEGTVTGSFNEMTLSSGIILTPDQQLSLLGQYGGLDAWGTNAYAPHYAAAWAWAGNTPFQWGKQIGSHLGGTRDGIEQEPMHGTSFAYTFDQADAAERHTQQYFETWGNRAIYKDGWWACAKLDRIPWDVTAPTMARFAPGTYDPEKDTWELYYLPDDFTLWGARSLPGL
jgi:arylsulfatase A-like enzyme